MDTINWRFNSNSDLATEFRGFHFIVWQPRFKMSYSAGYHLKAFLFDGHFPHYISLDWAPLNCWDIMRYQPRSHWYLEQVWSVLRKSLLSATLHCLGCLGALPDPCHGSQDWECGTFYESEEINCRHGMEYSIWTASTLFIPDNDNPRASPHSHSSQWWDYWIYVLPESRNTYFSSNQR